MKRMVQYKLSLKQILIALFVFLLIICGSTNAVSQTHYKPHISVGGHAGIALSQITFTPEVPQSWILGPTFGVQIRFAEEKLVGLLGEINFITRGWKESFDEHKEYQYSRSLSYISVPLMTHISYGSKRFKGFLNLGPEFNLLVSSSISSNFDYENASKLLSPNRHTNQMGMEISKKFDYGITAGLGGEYYFTPRQSVYIEARFYYGLGNIFASTKSDEFSSSRSMSIVATLGYNFRLK